MMPLALLFQHLNDLALQLADEHWGEVHENPPLSAEKGAFSSALTQSLRDCVESNFSDKNGTRSAAPAAP